MTPRLPRLVAFVLLTALAFGPAWKAPFDFDDVLAIAENTTIVRAWPPNALWNTPPMGTAASGRPVANYSFALNYAVNRAVGISRGSPDPAPRETISFHIVNMLLHLATAFVLFALIARTIQGDGVPAGWRSDATAIATIVAGLWLVHPIQTEAVDYVSQRTEVLASLCYLGTLYAALRAWEAERAAIRGAPMSRATAWSIAAVAICFVGTNSKEIGVTAPLAVILYDCAFFRGGPVQPHRSATRRRTYAALLATMLWPVWLVVHGARGDTLGSQGGAAWWTYAYSQGWAITHYIKLMLWPAGLAFDYGRNPVTGVAPLLGCIACALAIAAAIAAWRVDRVRWIGFLGAFFFPLLAPSSSIVPIRTEIAAERRVYLASAAIVVLLVVAAIHFAKRLHWETTMRRGFYALIVLLALLSAKRSLLYDNLVARWTDAVAVTPSNGRAYDNLASALLRAQPPNMPAADSVLHRAMIADPGFVPAWVRAASIALAERRAAAAESLLTHALALHPGDLKATDAIATVYLAEKRPDRALPFLMQLVAFDPTSTSSLKRVGVAYLMAGSLDTAIVWLKRAEQRDTTLTDATSYLSAALVQQDRGAEAIPRLERLAKTNPTGITLGLLALAYAQAGDTSKALHASNVAVLNASDNPVVYVFAGRALQTVGIHDEAAQALERAVRLAPNDAEAFTWLGRAYGSMGQTANAIAALRRAVALAPSNEAAKRELAHLGVNSIKAP